ncbi:hypothetical protein LPJ75_005281, partial [Coemansia sp. RSA 2598]
MAGTYGQQQQQQQQTPSHHKYYYSGVAEGQRPAYPGHSGCIIDQKSSGAADARFRKHLMHGSGADGVGTKDVHPHIFVPEQPIFGHSAMSKDKTRDYIRPGPSDEPLAVTPPHHALPARAPLMSSMDGRVVRFGSCSERSSEGFSLAPPAAARMHTDPGIAGYRCSSGGGDSGGTGGSGAMSVSALLGKRMRVGCGDFSDDDDEDDDDDDDAGSSGASSSNGAADVLKSPGNRVAASDFPTVPLPLASSQTASGSEATSIPSSPTMTVRSDEPRKGKSRRTESPVVSAKKTSPPPISGARLSQQQQQHRSPDAEDKPEVDWQSLGVPEDIWVEAQELYDKVKVMKKVQNRQPRRMKPAILAALMFILCRSHGYPRTFAELCAAANVTKREIGMYYKLMNQVLDAQYTTTERAKPSAFLQRWCTALDLPLWIPDAACKVYDRADEMGIVQGKSPVSISAASIWLVIWCFNHYPGLQHRGFALPADTPVSSSAMPNVPALVAINDPIRCDQRD